MYGGDREGMTLTGYGMLMQTFYSIGKLLLQELFPDWQHATVTVSAVVLEFVP